MAKKNGFVLTGSVQEKNGKLYLVYPHYDPIKQVAKPKWKSMGLYEGEKKAVIEKRKRELLRELEAEETRLREGYDNPENYPLLEFLTDWLEGVHRHKIQETTLQGYRIKINGKIKAYFGSEVTLDDCKPKLIHGFYESLRAEGVSERTVIHYHNLLHAAFEYAVRQEIFDVNPMNRVERPQAKKFVGEFYSPEELQTLLALTEDESIYIPIVLAAFYGLRPASTAMVASAGVTVVLATFVTGEIAAVADLVTAIDWRYVVLAAVLLVLTRWCKATKKLHPIVFIALSAVVGVVLKF